MEMDLKPVSKAARNVRFCECAQYGGEPLCR